MSGQAWESSLPSAIMNLSYALYIMSSKASYMKHLLGDLQDFHTLFEHNSKFSLKIEH